MRKIRTAVFAGVAALAAAGTALAAPAETRVMKVGLPDGSIAQIEYRGEIAPKVIVAPAARLVPVQWIDPFDVAPFAMFDRMAAAMSRQSDLMMRQMLALRSQPNAPSEINIASFGALPAGTVSYRYVATSSGAGSCSRSVEITSLGSGQKPKVVSRSSGDCGGMSPAPADEKTEAPTQGRALYTT
jgi:hypothetical protein